MACICDLDLAGAAKEQHWKCLIANGVANKNQKDFVRLPDWCLSHYLAIPYTTTCCICRYMEKVMITAYISQDLKDKLDALKTSTMSKLVEELLESAVDQKNSAVTVQHKPAVQQVDQVVQALKPLAKPAVQHQPAVPPPPSTAPPAVPKRDKICPEHHLAIIWKDNLGYCQECERLKLPLWKS